MLCNRRKVLRLVGPMSDYVVKDVLFFILMFGAQFTHMLNSHRRWDCLRCRIAKLALQQQKSICFFSSACFAENASTPIVIYWWWSFVFEDSSAISLASRHDLFSHLSPLLRGITDENMTLCGLPCLQKRHSDRWLDQQIAQLILPGHAVPDSFPISVSVFNFTTSSLDESLWLCWHLCFHWSLFLFLFSQAIWFVGYYLFSRVYDEFNNYLFFPISPI